MENRVHSREKDYALPAQLRLQGGSIGGRESVEVSVDNARILIGFDLISGRSDDKEAVGHAGCGETREGGSSELLAYSL